MLLLESDRGNFNQIEMHFYNHTAPLNCRAKFCMQYPGYLVIHLLVHLLIHSFFHSLSDSLIFKTGYVENSGQYFSVCFQGPARLLSSDKLFFLLKLTWRRRNRDHPSLGHLSIEGDNMIVWKLACLVGCTAR